MDPNLKSVRIEKVPPSREAPSKKMRAPLVRQTLASKYRMLKSNPLLVHELEKKIMSNPDNKDESLITPLKTLVTVLDTTDSEVLSKFNISYNPTQTHTASTTRNNKNLKRCESNKEISKREFVHPLDVRTNKSILPRNLKKNQLKESQSVPKLLTASVDRNLNTASSTKNLKKNLITRTFGTTTVQKTKSLKIVNTDTSILKNKKSSVSAPFSNLQGGNEHKELKTKHTTNSKLTTSSNVGTPHLGNTAGRNSIAITPNNKAMFLNATCAEKNNGNNVATQKSSVTIKGIRNTLSPTFSARNSLFLNTPNNKRKSIFVSKQTSNEMTQSLSEWLKHRGKSFKEYHHLKCFGVHLKNTVKVQNSDVEKENVENCEVIENNLIKEVPVAPTEEVNLSAVAQEALMDLHKLILDGYPPEQCEIWLKLIKQKFRQVEEEPQYWECRAALEQTKGNINLAVECYKTAIIQGAEVQNVDKCLDQLLQKFSLLNINNETDSYVSKKERNKIVQDARNIFKSSIIQFAVQEKVLKKKSKEGITIEKKVVATPVRRSTRLSRSAFTSTPGIHIYSSLQEVDTCIRDNLNFQCNNALKE